MQIISPYAATSSGCLVDLTEYEEDKLLTIGSRTMELLCDWHQ